MRALLGLLLLGGLFLSAATWQSRTTERLREQRAREFGVPADAPEGATRLGSRAGWSELVLGRPSGAPPLPVAARPGVPKGGQNGFDGSDAGWGESDIPATPPRFEPDFEYVVQPHDVLSVICQRHYGKGRLRELVPLVTKYNDLKSADGIEAGKVLLLPDQTLLLGAAPDSR